MSQDLRAEIEYRVRIQVDAEKWAEKYGIPLSAVVNDMMGCFTDTFIREAIETAWRNRAKVSGYVDTKFQGAAVDTVTFI